MQGKKDSLRLLPPGNYADAAAGVATTLFGVFFTVAASRIPTTPMGNSVLEAKHLPLLVGIGLVLTGLALTVQGVAKVWNAAVANGRSGYDNERPNPVNRRNLLVVSLLLLGYLLTFVPLGYLLSTFLFLAIGTLYLDRQHALRNLIFAVALTIAVFYLFDTALGVPLPDGVLGPVL